MVNVRTSMTAATTRMIASATSRNSVNPKFVHVGGSRRHGFSNRNQRAWIDTDILIVGGGIAGASLGARLAAERRILLIEAEELCGRHATGRSVAFWQASLGGDTPERRLEPRLQADVRPHWPGASTPLLRSRGALHLTGAATTRSSMAGLRAILPCAPRPRRARREWFPGCARSGPGPGMSQAAPTLRSPHFHAACLADDSPRWWYGADRRGAARGDAIGRRVGGRDQRRAQSRRPARQCRRRLGRRGRAALRFAADPRLEPRRRTVVQLRVGRRGLRDLPLVTDLHAELSISRAKATTASGSSPLDETLVDPCDAAPRRSTSPSAIDRFEGRRLAGRGGRAQVGGPAHLRPRPADEVRLRRRAPTFFWCVGQGGMGIQTAPAASLLCASLIRGEAVEAPRRHRSERLRPELNRKKDRRGP